MKSPSRTAVVFDRHTGSASHDIVKFVKAIGAVLKEDGDVLSLCLDGAAPKGDARRRSGYSIARGARAAVSAFQPDLVIYVPSPRPLLSMFYRGFTLRRFAADANHVMFPLVPLMETRLHGAVLRKLYPGLILVPSYKSLLSLSRLSLDGDVIPFGVDPNRYRPVGLEERAEIRKQHGISEDAFVFLLGSNSGSDAKDVIAALGDDVKIVDAPHRGSADSSSARRRPVDSSSGRSRRAARTEDPRESYMLADCFVFADKDTNQSVEIPMDVVEALACGVPVLTTPFGGLRDFFLEGPDLVYWSTVEQLNAAARRLREDYPAQVRSVDEFSWQNVVRQIRGHFCM